MLVRLAWRTLFRAPWYAATAIGTIALTVALAAAVFGVVDGVLFKPLPYPEADRLFTAMGASTPDGARAGSATLAALDVKYLAEADPRIAVTATGGGIRLTPAHDPEGTIWAAGIEPTFFDVVGVRPMQGGFTADHFAEAEASAVRSVVVAHAFWRRRLGADPAAVGRTLDMSGTRMIVAGVLPPDFAFPVSQPGGEPQILIPLAAPAAAAGDRWARRLQAVVRLRDGITREQAQAALDRALAARVGEYPARQAMPGPYVAVRMTSVGTALGQTERPWFRVAFAGAALLVLLGAINVAGLFTARSRDRERELAVRTALGGSRQHLVGVLMSEAAILALAGGVIGASLARPLLDAAALMLPPTLAVLKTPAVDWRVVMFALVAAVLPVMLFALAPAMLATRGAEASRLSGNLTTTPRVRARARALLLVAESAIGIALVVVGSLLLVSFAVLRSEDPGLDAERLAVVELRMTGTVAPAARSQREARALEVMERVPGVTGMATVGAPVLEGMFAGSRFRIPDGAEKFTFASDIPVSRRFFEIAGLKVIAGRVPTPAEIDSMQPVAVVSDDVARRYWPGRTAVGQVLDGVIPATVVAVVEGARFGAQDDDSGDRSYGEIYVAAGSLPSPRKVFLLQASASPNAVVRAAAAAVQRDMPDVVVTRAETIDAALARSVLLERFRTAIFSLAGGAGLLLLAVGIGSLVAAGVAQRVREIGIRSALGAQQPQLVTMIVAEHLRPMLLGVALGLLGSWWATRLVRGFLYEIDPHEPTVWVGATATLFLAATVAAWIPARRASRADPVIALRTE